jgi:hypothetical protein
MLEEMKLVNMIANVKDEAQSIAKKMGDSSYEVAQKLLKNKYGRMISLEEIEKFWERKVFTLPDQPDDEEPEKNIKGKLIDLDSFDPTGKKPKMVFIIDKWHDVTSWRKMYILVCEELIKRHPDTNLGGHTEVKPIWKKGSEFRLINGKYINVCKSASSHLELSKKVLKLLNYDVQESLKIEI